MAVTRFDVDQLPAMPWKNGGGVTREITCQPPGAPLDGFDWRLSIAHIASDGPFSAFPGIDRVITLLQGAGVHLQCGSAGWEHRLDQALQPFAFAGEDAIHARLIDGDCHDFNVMTRRSACRAEVQVLRGATELSGAPAGMLLATHGEWRLHSGDAPAVLSPHQGLWWTAQELRWTLTPTDPAAALLAVLIHPA